MSQFSTPTGLKPHRGTTILVLGILSLVFQCAGWIFGIIAWVMANNDLPQMDAGVMDPAGRGGRGPPRGRQGLRLLESRTLHGPGRDGLPVLQGERAPGGHQRCRLAQLVGLRENLPRQWPHLVPPGMAAGKPRADAQGIWVRDDRPGEE